MRANSETGLKVCSKCRVEQPVKNFYEDKSKSDYLSSSCQICRSAQATTHYHDNKEHHRARRADFYRKNRDRIKASKAEFLRRNPGRQTDWHRKGLYGLSPEGVASLIDKQGGKCPGCLKNLSAVRFCVDHDHSTGKVRGLLCPTCNGSLGMAKDDLAILLRLIEYLKASCA